MNVAFKGDEDKVSVKRGNKWKDTAETTEYEQGVAPEKYGRVRRCQDKR